MVYNLNIQFICSSPNKQTQFSIFSQKMSLGLMQADIVFYNSLHGMYWVLWGLLGAKEGNRSLGG
jgi:hypothetical protein